MTRNSERLIVAATVVVFVIAAIFIPSGVRSPHTGPGNRILNRLREIERAKEHWRAGHPDTHPEALTEQDLAPHLSQDFWKQTVAGERYLIHSLDEPPEAVMTKDVDWIPKGMKVRFSPEPDGKVEVRPNERSGVDAGRASLFALEGQWRHATVCSLRLARPPQPTP